MFGYVVQNGLLESVCGQIIFPVTYLWNWAIPTLTWIVSFSSASCLCGLSLAVSDPVFKRNRNDM